MRIMPTVISRSSDMMVYDMQYDDEDDGDSGSGGGEEGEEVRDTRVIFMEE